jgi:hypothetical protein
MLSTTTLTNSSLQSRLANACFPPALLTSASLSAHDADAAPDSTPGLEGPMMPSASQSQPSSQQSFTMSQQSQNGLAGSAYRFGDGGSRLGNDAPQIYSVSSAPLLFYQVKAARNKHGIDGYNFRLSIPGSTSTKWKSMASP